MKNSIISFFLLSITLLSFTGCAQDRTVEGKDMEETIQLLGEAYITDGPLIGAVIGIIDKGEQKFYAFGNKESGKENLPDAETIYEIGSISKTFTGTLLAIQSLNNEVSVESPIIDYLPEGVSVPEYEGKKITFEDLVTHSSALPRMPDNFNKYVKKNAKPYINYPISASYDYLKDYELTRSIGGKYDYSNFGFGLLGHLVGRIDSSDYETALQNLVFNELKMNNSGVRITDQHRKNMALPHSGSTVVSNWEFTEAFMGAGAIKSNLNDMFKYLDANMHPENSSLKDALLFAQKPNRSAGVGKIGMGWHINPQASSGDDLTWHNGGTGGYQSFMGFNGKKEYGVIVLSNTSTKSVQEATEMGFQLLNALEKFRAQ